MSTTFRIMRRYDADSTNGYDDYTCIAPFRQPHDGIPCIPRGPFDGGQDYHLAFGDGLWPAFEVTDYTPLRAERIASHA